MNELLISLGVLYIVITLAIGFSVAIAWWATSSDSDVKLFWLPNHIIKEWCDEYNVNKIEHCIADIVMNLLLGPATLLAIAIVGFCAIPVLIVTLFIWLFRKR